MQRACLLFLALMLLSLPGYADTEETVFFRQLMSTANEVPPVEGVTASARAIISLHIRRNDAGNVVSGVVDFDVDYNFAESATVIGLHIHQAAAGVNGPILIDSGLSGSNTVQAEGSGSIFRQVVVQSGDALAALTGILSNPGNYYVNLHTTTFPGGIMRGQLARADLLVFRAVLDPANEVPPADSDAAGSASVLVLANRNDQGVITRHR